MSFVRPVQGGIIMSYHPKVSMIIYKKGCQSRQPCRSSLGNDFYRLTSFGSVARPSTMTPTATLGSLATTPADTLVEPPLLSAAESNRTAKRWTQPLRRYRYSGSARRLDTQQKIVGFWVRCTWPKWPPNIPAMIIGGIKGNTAICTRAMGYR
jgi:hypothetical protein